MRRWGIMIFLLAVLSGCHRQPLHEQVTTGTSLQVSIFDSLARECVEAARRMQYDSSVVIALRMLEVAGETESVNDSLLALAYISDAFDYCSQYDSSRRYIEMGLALWNRCEEGQVVLRDSSPVYKLYNAEGVVALQADYNFEKAVSCFLKGMEYTDSFEEGVVLGINLTVTSFFKGDSDGYAYVSDLYKAGYESGDDRLRFYGAYGLAMMECTRMNYDRAADFAAEAIRYNDKGNYSSDLVLQALYGDMLGRQGRYVEAEEVLENVYGRLSDHGPESTSLIYVCMVYADFMRNCGRLREAVDAGLRGVAFSERYNNRLFDSHLFLGLSKTYSGMKDYRNALYYYGRYDTESRKLFDIQQEWVLKELNIKYQTASREAELQQSKVSLMKRNREFLAAMFSTVVVLLVLIFTILLYRHKNRMYLHIVRQYNEAGRRERELQQELDMYRLKEVGNQCGNDRLFMELENLFRDKQVWREKYLTRDKVVEMLKTNRTYLSQVVNEKTGKTFTQYMNGYRISEAIRLLSDVSNDIPLKAIANDTGFSSLTTFYKMFREEVGMTPAKYREKVLELYKSN